MRIWIGLAALALLAACAPQSQTPQGGGEPEVSAENVTPPESTPQQASGQLPAPVAADVRTITIDQARQTVSVAVGERFAVALVGIPTAGYLWQAQTTPAFLTASGEGGGPTTREQQQPGYAGGYNWEVFYYTASAAGEGALTLVQRRPWERDTPPAQTFTVTIRAQ